MKRSYSSGIAFALASVGSVGVTTLLTSILTARIYGVTVVGESALVLAPVTIVTLLSTVREQPAMVREIAKLKPRHPKVTGVFLAVFAFSFLLTLGATIVGIAASYLLFHGPIGHPSLFAPTAVALCGYLLIINTCWNIDGVLGAFRAGRELFAVRLHQAVMYGVLIVGFSFVAHDVWSLTAAFLCSWLATLAHRLVLLPRVLLLRVPLAEIRSGFAKLREIVVFGLKITPGFIAAGLSDSSGTWILGIASTVNAVGAYSRASNIATRFGELNWRVTEMLLPTLVQRQSVGDVEGYNRVVRDSLRYVAFGMLLPAAVGGGAADAVMHLFGPGFGPAATALRWLLFVPLLQTLTSIQGAVLLASNMPLWTTVAQSVRLVVTLTGGVLLTLAFGLTGMALAVSAGCLTSFGVFALVMYSRSRGPLPRASWLVRQLAGLGTAYAAGFLVARLVERQFAGVFGLTLALAAGSLAYAVVGVAVGGTTGQDRDRLRGLIAAGSGRLRRAKPPLDPPAGSEDVPEGAGSADVGHAAQAAVERLGK